MRFPPRMRLAFLVMTVGFGLAGFSAQADDAQTIPARLEIQKGDHVAIVGNTLADRMQRDAWLDAYLISRFPMHDLTIRDLGFSGDEVEIRLRSMNFGTPDHWLNTVKADVILAFFGSNEAHAGPEGLEAFRASLDNYLKHLLAQKFNGKSAPRVVLGSPIAHENRHERLFPDGVADNVNREAYAKVMAEVAAANGAAFVDLFHPTLDLYAASYTTASKTPLTTNGIHPTPDGNRQIAQVIDRALFGPDEPAGRTPERLEAIRQAALDKNFTWYNRYRTVDGYSMFGERAFLKFTDGQTNFEVAQRELEVLDVMTTNRDARLWAVAQERDLKVDDSNTPPFIPVKTNKPGKGPNGEHVFLGGEEAIGKMTVAKGLKVNLFASEERFPELAKPVQMSFDAKGRLWVAVWPTYPHAKPKEAMDDKLLIFEDTDGDGKADKVKTFADHLHCTTGFEFSGGGVIVAQAPDLVFLRDTDGDDKADTRQIILSGLDTADTHHTANSFQLDPGGALYFQEGTFHHTQVETPYGPPVRNINAGVYRYEPRTQKFDVYVTYAFANPHGHAFDRWGRDIITDGTMSDPFDGALFSGHIDYPRKHPRPPTLYKQRTRPCPAIEILSSSHFPDDFQGDLLVGNVIGFQGILRYKLADKGSTIAGTEAEPILSSTDENFRPSDLEIAPDGSLYFLDWQNPIIGHMQHNLRDPSRDRIHGRIYRVTAEGRPLQKPDEIAGQPVAKLLDLLKSPQDRVRYRVRIELGARPTAEVLTAVAGWVNGLDRADPNYDHHILEALWVQQNHNVVGVSQLDQLVHATPLEHALHARDPHARAAATRILSYAREYISDSLSRLKTLAADPDMRVRLEAVRGASFFKTADAVEVPLIAAELPSDDALDFVRNETMKALEPIWKAAIASGHPPAVTSDAGARFLFQGVATEELLKLPRSRGIDLVLLMRKGVLDATRQDATADLARRSSQSEATVILEAIRSLDEARNAPDPSVVLDLARLLAARPAAEVAQARPLLQKLATHGQSPLTRERAFAALIDADGGSDLAWTLAQAGPAALKDFLAAVPLTHNPSLLETLYERVRPLLDRDAGDPPIAGRYVRVELPGSGRVLTLAEVEAYSGGRNVARQGQSRQSSTAYGGDAARGIDGNADPVYGQGGQTHTEEGVTNPWWEVDLGDDFPLDRIVIANRGEGFQPRLEGFSVRVLDGQRRVVATWDKLPAPDLKTTLDVQDPNAKSAIHRAAMLALATIPGHAPEVVPLLARAARDGADPAGAIQALRRIPTNDWPPAEVAATTDALLARLGQLDAPARASASARDTFLLVDSLAPLLPPERARNVRKTLGELGVRVIRIGTVFDQMRYDQDQVVVQAGRPVQFAFENGDNMPHNFVVTRPGSLETIGLLAESTGTQPDAPARDYVPRSDQVLVASRLLQPTDSQALDFQVPNEPGVYPYVCTYPGHWRRMYGALLVVADLDAYLADPDAYLVNHPTPTRDELLAQNRTRRAWTLADLSTDLAHLNHGRSADAGFKAFQTAACVSCHRLGGQGVEIGPDLSKLDAKVAPEAILKSLLEPSETIDDKYRSHTFALESGRVVTGLVLEETPTRVKVSENPLARAEPVVLDKSEISERQPSTTSIMPKGLLDKLTREEVLDLLAFLAARGDRNHPSYRGGHDHHATP